MTKAQVQIIQAIADTIRELKTVVSGHLYAHLMGKISLEQYQDIIEFLKRSGLVTESNFQLSWNHDLASMPEGKDPSPMVGGRI